ncbi:MAG: TatD family hydrolase, partial [bacterium]|nr:TatD family hydrolase [bacterium]
MIIDTHTHLSFNSSLDSNIDELIASMKKAGIGKTFVYAGEFGDCSTEKLLNTVREHKETLYPIGSVSPLSLKRPSLKNVEEWLKTGQI